jgi:L-aspartate oxidase
LDLKELKHIPLNIGKVKKTIEVDFLIIGGGVAGLSAAIETARYGRTLILSKDKISEGCTDRAQGGIAVVFNQKESSLNRHINDTLITGVGLCDKRSVRMLVEEGPLRVKKLIKWGGKFDKKGNRFDFAQEGAHSERRIIHARGDATGHEVERVLLAKVKRNKNIKIKEKLLVVEIIVKNKECLGVIALDIKENKFIMIIARATVIAAGGLGQIYKHTTNSFVATGDGFSLGYRAGCVLRDMEFIHFHPTVLLLAKTCFLISESLRGEGGILRNKKGYAFMNDYHRQKDLAARDIVSRAIFDQMYKNRTQNVFLDATHLKANYLKSRFPNIERTCRGHGFNISRDYIPVRPAAHFTMGGIKTDLYGRTNITRLFACGEVASVGVHGANRLASNSLLEGLVFGARAGIGAGLWYKKKFSQIRNYQNMISEKRKLKIKPNFVNIRQVLKIKDQIRLLMEKRAGIIRCKVSLGGAERALEKWRNFFFKNTGGAEYFQLVNMYITANLVVHSAKLRRESRGGHYRSDYPKQNDKMWKKHIEINSKCKMQKSKL